MLNGKAEQPANLEQNKRLVLYVQLLGWGSLSITTQVILLENEFYVRSVLHGHVSLADVNQNLRIH